MYFVLFELFACISQQASCLPAFVLSPDSVSVVIDSCAAPGNKTSHIADIMNNKGYVQALIFVFILRPISSFFAFVTPHCCALLLLSHV